MLKTETVLPELLEVLAGLESSEAFEGYILAGGTALALQIGHRRSDDIDLFTAKEMDSGKLLGYIQSKYGGDYGIYHSEKNILQTTIKNIKVDFVSMPAAALEDPVEEQGLRLFGLKDLAAMKLRAIGNGRNKAKDYIDLCYLLKHYSLGELFGCYKKKYATGDITHVKKALAASAMVNPYEWEKICMIRNDIFISDIPSILKGEIIKYNNENGITPKKRRLWG
jgi:predicted nucleotidyltransferase component of viral defense system